MNKIIKSFNVSSEKELVLKIEELRLVNDIKLIINNTYKDMFFCEEINTFLIHERLDCDVIRNLICDMYDEVEHNVTIRETFKLFKSKKINTYKFIKINIEKEFMKKIKKDKSVIKHVVKNYNINLLNLGF